MFFTALGISKRINREIMTWIKKGIIWNKHHSQLPVVDVLGGIYKIYYSTRDEQGRSIPMWFQVDRTNPSKTLNHSVEPILLLGKPGSFDSHGIMPSSIITLEDGTKYMYYVGWSKRIDVPYWNSTGLAISKDNGVTWEKYSEGPVFNTGILETGFIGTTYVIRGKAIWVMYYSSCRWIEDNKLEPFYDIKQAVSDDGINWRPLDKTVIQIKEEEGGVAAIGKLKNKFIYSKRNKSDYRTNPLNSYKIYSCDLNGINEQLELFPEGDEIMCAYPFVVEEEDKYIMFYNSDFGKSGISYAIKMK